MDHRDSAIERAIHVYGESPEVLRRRETGMTLQGRTETGFVVVGRAHGGDQLRCLFPTREAARAAIKAARADMGL